MDLSIARKPSHYGILALFCVCVVLQFADLHSSISANSSRFEVNPVVLWFASFLGPVGGLLAAKAIGLAFIGLIFSAWKLGGDGLTKKVAWLLLLLAAFYGFIVANNYLG